MLVTSAKEDVESEAWKEVENQLASLSKEERDRPGSSKCEGRNVMTSIVDVVPSAPLKRVLLSVF